MKGKKPQKSNFRSEVFKLCKKLQENDSAKQVGSLIHDLSVSVENTETGIVKNKIHGDFAHIAQHSNNQFHGYLFLDDNIGKVDIPHLFTVEHLSTQERILIEKGHNTLTKFIDLCLADIACRSDIVAKAMNPYFLYKEVRVSQTNESLIPDTELLLAASAFKNGTVYRALTESNFTKLFENVDLSSMQGLLGTLEREVNKSLGENEVKDLKDFSLRLHSKLDNIADVMIAFSILIFALEESLKLSCRLLYRAICGIDLFVLNEENIINIEKKGSNTICEFYKVFAQDLPFDYTGSEMGSILLLDCDMPYGSHIHEFGMVTAETLNLIGEFGQTAKYSFVTVNEELIHIHNITEKILNVGLPAINVAP